MKQVLLLAILILLLVLTSCGGGSQPTAQTQQPAATSAPAPSQPLSTQPTVTPVPKANTGNLPTFADTARKNLPTGTVTIKDALSAVMTAIAMPTGSYATPALDASLKGAAPAEIFRVLISTAVPGSSFTNDDIAKGIVAMAFEGALKTTPAAGSTARPQQSTQPTSTPVPTISGKVGEPLEVNGVKITVHSLKRTGQINQFLKAKEGQSYIIADVTVENVGQAEHDHNPFWFKLRDGEGRSYNAGFGADPAFSTGKIIKGEKARGFVSFEVPTSAKILVLVYDTVPLAGRDKQARIELGDVP